MGFIKKIQSTVRQWFLKRAHKKILRRKKMLGYHQASSFGIIYDANTEENYKLITLLVKDLQQDGKKVKTLGFVNLKKMPDYCFPKLTFEFCNPGSFSWTQQPVSQNVKDFVLSGYDILIDFTPSSFHQVKYASAISLSSMKAGRYHDKYIEIFDLMLQIDDELPLKETIEQTMFYLKMINNGH